MMSAVVAKPRDGFTRRALGALLAFVALNAFAAGTILLLWMTAQLTLIGYTSWLQPTFVAIALLILVLTIALPR